MTKNIKKYIAVVLTFLMTISILSTVNVKACEITGKDKLNQYSSSSEKENKSFSITDGVITQTSDKNYINYNNRDMQLESKLKPRYDATLSNLNVSVDKTIIKVGQDNEVVVNVKDGNNPVPNEKVVLEGNTYYINNPSSKLHIEGTTDANGECKFSSVNPIFSEEINIIIRTQYYTQKLFSINDDEAVAEITAKDRDEKEISNFYLAIDSEHRGVSGPDNNGLFKCIVNKGLNSLALRTENNSNGDFSILKYINITEGIVNKIDLHLVNFMKATINLKFDGTAMPNTNVYMDKDNSNNFELLNIANTDSAGNTIVYLESGTYKVASVENMSATSKLYLRKENIQIDTEGNYNIGWVTSETGMLQFKTTGQLSSYDKSLWIDDVGIYLGDEKDVGILMQTGTHNINSVYCDSSINNIYDSYSFSTYQADNHSLFIKSDAPIVYNFNTDVKNVGIRIYTTNIKQGSNVNFSVETVTGTNHILSYGNNVKMAVTIKKPNGDIVNIDNPYLSWMSYFVKADDPIGQYTINVDVDFGSLYPKQTLTSSFDVTEAVATPAPTVAPTIAPPTSPETVENGQYLTLPLGIDPPTLDSSLATDNVSFEVLGECMEGLVRQTKDGNKDVLIPAAAKKWEVSPDGLRWTFHLRDSYWSDGVKVKAKDFEYAWKKLLNPNHGGEYAYFLYLVAGAEEYNEGKGTIDKVGIKAIDDNTFEVVLKKPDTTFEKRLTMPILYPIRQDIVESLGDKYGTPYGYKQMVYNGPFTISNWYLGQLIVLSKNNSYWDNKNVTIEKVNLISAGLDMATQIQMFENKQLDETAAARDWIQKLKDEAATGKFIYETRNTLTSRYFVFNCKSSNKLLTNDKIRKALALAFDRKVYTSVLYKRNVPSYSLVPPQIAVGDALYGDEPVSEPINELYKQYPTAADWKNLFIEGLKELGLDPNPSNNTIEFMDYGSTSNTKMQEEFIQNQWNTNLGVNVKIKSLADWGQFLDAQKNGEFEVCMAGWGPDYNDPLTYMNMWTTDNSLNKAFYSNPEYDELINKASTELDQSKRMIYFKQAEKILIQDDTAIAPIQYDDEHIFTQNYIKGIQRFIFGVERELKYAYTARNGETVDTIAPEIKEIAADSGKDNVSIYDTVSVRFSEYVDKADKFDFITLKDSENNEIKAKKYLTGNLLTIVPEGNLKYNESYTVEIPDGAVKDSTGNKLTAGQNYTFNTIKGDFPFIITNLSNASQFKLGEDAIVSIGAKNITGNAQKVILIVALFDKDNKFISYCLVNRTVENEENTILSAGLRIPKSGVYTVKAFVWDGMDTMNPLSDVLEFKVK